MISKPQLETIKQILEAQSGIENFPIEDLMDTLVNALRVVKAAKKVQMYYHGKLNAQGALSDLDDALKPFDTAEKGE